MENESFADWRQRLGLSQVQAAAVLGITERQVQNFESDLAPVGREPQDPSRALELAMRYLEEHPGELRAALTAAPMKPLTAAQIEKLRLLAGGRVHDFDRKIGLALVRRGLAKDGAKGFSITAAGRALLRGSRAAA